MLVSSSLHVLDAGEQQPNAGFGLVAAINTPKMQNTDQCGACYEVQCVDGATRGRPESTVAADTGCMCAPSYECTLPVSAVRRLAWRRSNLYMSLWPLAAIAPIRKIDRFAYTSTNAIHSFPH